MTLIRTRLSLAVATLAALCVAWTPASAGVSTRADHAPRISWADRQHRHGWASVAAGEEGRWCPAPYRSARLCATEDGGRTWRGILFAREFERVVFDWTSRRAGLVAFRSESQPISLWTRDGGRHWFGTSIFGGRLLPTRIWHARSKVFWRSEPGGVYRVLGRPPREAAICPAQWISGIGVPGPRRNVCWDEGTGLAPAVNAGMRSVVVSRPPPRASWADPQHRHGWALEWRFGKPLCAAGRRLAQIRRYRLSAICATEDRGKTWRPILYTRRTVVSSFIRTSIRAGIVVAGYWNRERYWTRDNGRHWYRTDVLRPPGFSFRPTFVQRPDALYFRSFTDSGRLDREAELHSAVFRLEGWVPAGPLGCRPGALCDAGMRAMRVGFATFDAADGTGFLTEENARLATGWSAAELEARAHDASFSARLTILWEVTCAADDGSASSTDLFPEEGRVVVRSAPARDPRSQALLGFDLTGYAASPRGSPPPPQAGRPCTVASSPLFPPGHVVGVRRSPASVVWLQLFWSDRLFDVGDYPF